MSFSMCVWLQSCVVGIFMFLLSVSGDDDGVLKKYALLETGEISRTVVRWHANGTNPENYNRIEKLSFWAFSRLYVLYLTPRRLPLTKDFKAVAQDHDDSPGEHVAVDATEHFRGHLHGAEQSHVNAHISSDGAVTAVVFTPNAHETIYIEPAWRVLLDATVNQTIVYRADEVDLRMYSERPSKPCSFVQIDSDNLVNTSWLFDHSLQRTKRQTKPISGASNARSKKTRCSLKLVADYRFYENIGGNNDAQTVKYLIELIDRVNFIFESTTWVTGVEDQRALTGLGFVIKSVKLLRRYTVPPPGEVHYNMRDSDSWTANKILMEFSKEEGTYHEDFCLAHLFTYRKLDNGILGLGYIASSRISAPGGICSGKYDTNGVTYYANTALSSGRSSYGSPVITREADIVTAHEFGHNWGSPHDPVDKNNVECSPSIANGGPYIMHTYSLSGYDPNNNIFSPCSKRSIKTVLDAKSSFCFEEPTESFCGNTLVEGDEEYDAGLLGLREPNDPCCTQQCRLKQGARCSPKNSPCCTEQCQPQRTGTVCRSAQVNVCQRAASCDGVSFDCPPPQPVPDGTSCRDEGECQNGTCAPFCQQRSIGKQPCICEKPEFSCYRCCRTGNVCEPYDQPPRKLRTGSRCIHGSCDTQGVCIKEAQDFVEHIWDVIQKLDANAFLKFMRNNMVWTVIIISLIFWIPLSLFVHKIDKRRREEREKEEEFLLSDVVIQ